MYFSNRMFLDVSKFHSSIHVFKFLLHIIIFNTLSTIIHVDRKLWWI